MDVKTATMDDKTSSSFSSYLSSSVKNQKAGLKPAFHYHKNYGVVECDQVLLPRNIRPSNLDNQRTCEG